MCEVHRILINGGEEHSVHGRRLRRKIKEIADGGGFRGSVRNIKDKPQVEIRIVGGEAAENFSGRILKAINEGKSGFSGLQMEGPYGLGGEKAGDYHGFKVIREDELTEMVWALQGAGDIFLESAIGQREILGEISKIGGFLHPQ